MVLKSCLSMVFCCSKDLFRLLHNNSLKELYKTQINFFQNKIKYFNNIYLDPSTTTYFKHNALDQIKYFEQQITYYQTLINEN
jgi:hypothetical protein